ncbi:MAG: hypothetical protein QOJ65_395 [Fimbriimonadaceae bacterium]|jgi:spore coat polysaccharide biosynthesis protein SpsF|nr:hypothetical protein [Fimbriimonadaceae bacterium]
MTDELGLRRATFEDAELLWQWSNDPVGRQSSLNTAPIEWTTHVEWLRQKLQDPNCLLLIAVQEETPAAVVRFDARKGHLLVSISVAADFRGQGVGKKALSSGLEEAQRAWPSQEIHAYVKPENESSLSLFDGCGFTRKRQMDVEGGKVWHLVLHTVDAP